MLRRPAGAVGNLVAATGAIRNDERAFAGGAHGRQQRGFGHRHRDFVMLGLVAEAARHAAAGALDRFGLEPRHQRERGQQRRRAVEALAVAMGVDQGARLPAAV